jgi:hypothetical protein
MTDSDQPIMAASVRGSGGGQGEVVPGAGDHEHFQVRGRLVVLG